MLEICRKAPLARHLRRLREQFPEQYSFVPAESWLLPAELDGWRQVGFCASQG
jgi:hypothetical protein